MISIAQKLFDNTMIRGKFNLRGRFETALSTARHPARSNLKQCPDEPTSQLLGLEFLGWRTHLSLRAAVSGSFYLKDHIVQPVRRSAISA